MTSYQKLKFKCEQLEGQIRLFKNALSIYQTPPKMVKHEDGSFSLENKICIERNNLFDERIKIELQKWVAFNLDEENINELLKLKKKKEEK